MSEDLATGTDFTLANHGLKEAPVAPETPEPEQYGGGFEELKRAANDHTAERGSSTEQEPIERHLEWKSGEKRGQRVDMKAERFSLTPESAAQTLTDVHKAEAEIELRPQLEDLAASVDYARQVAAGAVPQPDAQLSAQAETPQPIDSPQPEAGEPPPSGLSPKLQQALQDPELRAAYEAPYQAAAQAQQAYTAAVSQVAGMLVAELAADLPEIIGLPPEQRMVGLQILQKQQPERFAAVEAKAARIQQVVNAQQQNAAIEAQQRQQAFQAWSKAQDKALEAKVPEIANDVDMKVSRAALKSLKDAGFSENELAAAWNGTPFSMRDARVQHLIYKASRYDAAMAGISQSEPKPLPAVQRPGVSRSVGDVAAEDIGNLRNEFRNSSGNTQLRAAVRLQQAQRAARR